MSEGRNLLSRLEEKKIDLEKMIKEEEFASTWEMSCPIIEQEHSVCYPVINHTKEQIEILFSSVPEIFPLNFRYSTSKKNLTEKQKLVLKRINKIASYRECELKPEYIRRIVRKGERYAKGSLYERFLGLIA